MPRILGSCGNSRKMAADAPRGGATVFCVGGIFFQARTARVCHYVCSGSIRRRSRRRGSEETIVLFSKNVP
jgi:hypothetical protein